MKNVFVKLLIVVFSVSFLGSDEKIEWSMNEEGLTVN